MSLSCLVPGHSTGSVLLPASARSANQVKELTALEALPNLLSSSDT